jgi:hypothetical protein
VFGPSKSPPDFSCNRNGDYFSTVFACFSVIVHSLRTNS